jgi:DNA-binding CsgD family transcriptional regulator/tetratricopeptide (TPR) repeat protein
LLQGVADNLGDMGVLYQTSDVSRAVDYFDRAINISRQIGHKHGIAIHLSNIGTLYAKQHDLEIAEKNFTEALAICEEIGVKQGQSQLHKDLAELYRSRQQWQQASEHFVQYNDLKEQVFNDEQKKSVENFNIRLAIAEKEREMEEQKLKAEFLEREMKRQQEELSNKALQLVKQTDMLENFRHNLEGIVRKTDSAEKAIKEVRQSLKELPENMLNWNKFHDDFHKVHPDFEVKLKQSFPTLSATEIKVCCLLRIGMNTREISTLLFISEFTVGIHRGHIRKKFGIDRNTDIRTVLEEL